jgi:hypothetical protein
MTVWGGVQSMQLILFGAVPPGLSFDSGMLGPCLDPDPLGVCLPALQCVV